MVGVPDPAAVSTAKAHLPVTSTLSPCARTAAGAHTGATTTPVATVTRLIMRRLILRLIIQSSPPVRSRKTGRVLGVHPSQLRQIGIGFVPVPLCERELGARRCGVASPLGDERQRVM